MNIFTEWLSRREGVDDAKMFIGIAKEYRGGITDKELCRKMSLVPPRDFVLVSIPWRNNRVFTNERLSMLDKAWRKHVHKQENSLFAIAYMEEGV